MTDTLPPGFSVTESVPVETPGEGLPPGFVEQTPDQWDEGTMTKAAKEGTFDPVQWAAQNKDKALSPGTLKKLANAHEATVMQGVTGRDLGKALENAPAAVGNLAANTAKFPFAAALALPGVAEAFQSVKEKAGLQNATPEQMDGLVDAAVAEGKFSKWQAPLVKRILKLGDKVASGTLAPEITAGIETSMQGLVNIIPAIGRKVANLTQKGAEALGAKPRSEEEVKNRFIDALSTAEMMDAAGKGEGGFTQFLQGNTIAELKSRGIELDPAMIGSLAEGNPLTFVAFGTAFRGAGKIIDSAGRTVAKVADITQAGRSLAMLRAAQSAYQRAATRSAGIASTENIARTEAASAGVRAARAGLTAGGRALEVASDAGKALVNAPAAIGGAALATAGKVGEAGAKVATWIGKSAPVIGLVKGFSEGGPVGALAGLKAGEMASGVVRRGAEAAGRAAAGVTELGKQVIKAGPESTPAAQLTSDVLTGAGTIAGGAAKGLGLDIGLTAATAETPQETAGMVPFGTIFGAAGAVNPALRRVVQGQNLHSRNWADVRPKAATPYGHFPALDALHAEAQGIASEGVKTRLGAVRQFADPLGIEVYQMPNRGALESFLVDYYQGQGMSAGDALAQAQIESRQSGIAKRLKDANGNVRGVSLLVDPAPAPHEAAHGLMDVLGSEASDVLFQQVFDEYAPQWESIGQDYANRVTGGRSSGDWRADILDTTGAGDVAGREQLVKETFENAAKLGAPLTPEEAYRMANADYDAALAAGEGWRNILTPEAINEAASRYLANELVAENFDVLFKHENPTLPPGNSLPEKFGRILARMAEFLGTDLYEGAKSEGLGIQPKRSVMETVKQVATGVSEIKKREALSTPAGKPSTPAGPAAPAPVGENQKQAQEVATATSDDRIVKLVNRIVANQQGANAPLRLKYQSVKGVPGGSPETFRENRRSEQEAAYIKEGLTSMDPDTRNAVMKVHAHTRFEFVKKGKEIQSIGYSLEKLVGNLQRVVDWVHKSGNTPLMEEIKSRYGVNSFETSLSEEGWKQFISDVQRYTENQQRGGTGAGKELKLPVDAEAMGVTTPAFEGAAAMKPIEQGRADFINMVMGFKLPETVRISRKGGTPGNVVGQRIAKANEEPFVAPRVSEPARPRGANELGVPQKFKGFEETIQEVNPVRRSFEERGFPVDQLVEVVERVNLKNLEEATPAPEVGFQAGVTDTIRAGFMPERAEDIIKMSSEDFAKAGADGNAKLGGGFSGTAVVRGQSMTPEMLADYRDGMTRAKDEGARLMQAGDFQGAMDMATKAQFFREAVEAATGGPIAEFTRKRYDANYRGAFEDSEKPAVEKTSELVRAMPEDKSSAELPIPGKAEFWLRPNGTIIQTKDEGHARMALNELPPETVKKLQAEKERFRNDEGEFDDSPLYQEMYDRGYVRGRQMHDQIYFENGDYSRAVPLTPEQRKTAESISFQRQKPARVSGSRRTFGFEKEEGASNFMPERTPQDEGGALPLPGKTQFWIRPDGSVLQEEGKSHFQMGADELGLKRLNANNTKDYTRVYSEMFDAGYLRGTKMGTSISIESPAADQLTRAQRAVAEDISFQSRLPVRFNNGKDFGYEGNVEDFFSPSQYLPEGITYTRPKEEAGDDSVFTLEARDKDGKQLGYVTSKKTAEDSAEISMVFVNPEDRRSGLGAELLSRAQDHWREAGVNRLILEPVTPEGRKLVDSSLGEADTVTQTKTGRERREYSRFMPTLEEWEASRAQRKAEKEKQTVPVAAGRPGEVQLTVKEPLDEAVGGELRLLHYGAPGLSTLDPKRLGKGAVTPIDLAGMPKTFFFVEGSKLQADQPLNVRPLYGVRVDGNGIYDLNKDPLDVLSNPNRYKRDQTLKDAGYTGFKVNTADGRRVVALYYPVNPTPIEKGKSQVSAQAAKGAQFMPEEQETFLEDLGQGSRGYSAAAVGQMTREELRSHYPEAIVKGLSHGAIDSNIVGSPLAKQARKQGGEPAAIKAFSDKLVEFYKQWEDNPALKAGESWYSEFTPLLKKAFGKDAQIFAELLAATSPNTTPEVNFGFANDAYLNWKDGHFDKAIKKFIEGIEKLETGELMRVYERDAKAGKTRNNPQNPSDATAMAHWIDKHNLVLVGSGGAKFGMHSVPVLRVLARKWLDLNSGPKTLNFVKNLLGTGDEATIDVWADRTMRRLGYEGFVDRWRILPENKTGVSDADFEFGQAAYRHAAERLGILPSALQGALWFAEKQLWANNGWGRLDLGDFRAEMQKLPLLRSGYEQRQARNRALKRVKPTEEQDFFGLDIQPRKQ